MARYKHIDTSPRFLAVDLSRQLLPGTFEHALNELLDHDLDLSDFDARYCNDETGATAYPPAMLLKVILFAYAQGIVSSRAIERAYREHVTFIALSGDSTPHFTTIADFVSTLGKDIANVFTQVLFICDCQGLIGREMFAIDGVKLPSNASKAKSGTRADFARQAGKLEVAVEGMLARHRAQDVQTTEPDLQAKETKRIERLKSDAAQLRKWLAEHPDDRQGAKGSVRKSNRTDNDSAKMATSKGVIRGYTGVAAVDAKHQIIVEAQAHGTGSEQELLVPVIEALIADNSMRGRDERFAGQDQCKALPDPLYDKSNTEKKATTYQPSDFTYDAAAKTCVCSAGMSLYRHGSAVINGYAVVRFEGAQRDCLPCSQRQRCLRTPAKTKTRQVAFFQGKVATTPESHTDRMKKRIDSPAGRMCYGRRFATVEPVFGNVRYNKGLDRFTLRGQAKVDAQWKLFCLVHNIEKLAHHGYAQ